MIRHNNKSISIIILSLVCLLSIYVYFSNREVTIKVSGESIKEALSEHLPFNQTYFSTFDVTLNYPQVTLLSDEKRILIGLNVFIKLSHHSSDKIYKGTADVSGGIKYESKTGKFFLTETNLNSLHINGIPAQYIGKTHGVISKSIAEYFYSHPVYILNGSSFKNKINQLVLDDVILEKGDVVFLLKY